MPSIAESLNAQPGPDSLAYWLRPFQGYWDRQGRMAREGLAMADQGAQQVRQGDLSGLAGMAFGPLNYLSSPINALFPIEEAQTQLPKEVSPFVAGGLELMALAAPGPKRAKVPGMSRIVDPKENLRTVIDSNFTGPTRVESATRSIDDLRGSMSSAQDDLARVDKLADQIASDSGYFERLIIDGNTGDVIEGQHRLNAARKLGIKDIPVTAIYDATHGLPVADMKAAVLATRKMPSDNVNQIVNMVAEAIAELRSAAAVRAEYTPPRGFEAAWNAALDAAEKRGGLPSSVTRDQALANLTEAPEGITAYHGSPHTFDKFDMSKIGTGEGAQAYGHGLYFAENDKVAESYRQTPAPSVGVRPGGDYDPTELQLAQKAAARGNPVEILKSEALRLGGASGPGRGGGLRKFPRPESDGKLDLIERTVKKLEGGDYVYNQAPPGSMYQVRLNVKPDELLDWDTRLMDQPEPVKQALGKFGIGAEYAQKPGALLYESEKIVPGDFADKKAAAEKLKAAGIKGIRYKDQGSRGSEGGTYNYVIFDDKLVDILKRYAIPFTLGAGGAAIVSGQDMPPEVASQLGPQA